MTHEATTNILTSLIDAGATQWPGEMALSGCDAAGCLRKSISWEELRHQRDMLARALCSMGLDAGDTVAVFSDNRPQVIVTDFAAFALRAVPVSIYATSSHDQARYIIDDAGAKVLFVGSDTQYRIGLRLMHECESLRMLVRYPDVEPDSSDGSSVSFEMLLDKAEKVPEAVIAEVSRRQRQATPQDIATIIYTSGTTGEPKGQCFHIHVLMQRCRCTATG